MTSSDKIKDLYDLTITKRKTVLPVSNTVLETSNPTRKVIIMKLSYASIAGKPFCDYLTVTMPAYALQSVTPSLQELFETAGMTSFDDGSTYLIDGNTGAFKLKTNPRYITLSASGGILEHFRNLKLFDQYITILNEHPHKITRLDATADYFVTYAPDVIQQFKIASNASKIVLTRKELSPSDIHYFLGSNEHGHETGTIYLGDRKTHSVYGKIYDKSFERTSKGYTSPGQTVRVELTLKADTGISLRDAHNPENVFYHYASRSLVMPPPHFIGWKPNVTGFELPAQKDLFTPAGKILNIFKFSTELSRAFRIAVKAFGPEALQVLTSQLRIAFLLKHPPTI